MPSQATSVEQYLASLPEDRRAALSAVRDVILENLDAGYAEGIQYGMIGYFVPHELFPAGYHANPKQPLPFAALGSQKSHMALYLMCVYGQPAFEQWFRQAWAKTGKKLDMGKSCVRFKKLDDVPLEVIGEAIRRAPLQRYLARYQASLGTPAKKAKTSDTAKPPTKKTSKTPSPARKPRKKPGK